MLSKLAIASPLIVAAAMAATCATAAMPDDYTVIELMPGFTAPSSGNAVSNTGIVVGCYAASPQTAFMWKDGQRTDLWNGCAYVVNDNGVIAGYDSSNNAVVWNNGTLTPLGMKYVTAINNAGWIVGNSNAFENNVYVQHDYLWHDGQLIEMPTGCSADINNLNQVLCNDNTTGAGIWQDGTITPLPPPPSDQYYTWTNFPSARALTDRTQVVGNARGPIYYENGVTHRVFMMSDGGIVDMNSSLVMLGDEEGIYGFITDPTGQIKYFANMPGPSVWHHMSPHAINESGWIVGNATTGPSASGESFLMIPKAGTVARPGPRVTGLPVMKRQRMDFDGDNRNDLLWRSGTNQHGAWLMDGTTIKSAATIAAPVNSFAQLRGDFNGDGKGDIVFADMNQAWWITLMDGTNASSTQVLNGTTGWNAVGVGDFDGDGKSDLLWYHPTWGFGVWLMNGTSITTAAMIAFPDGGWPAAIGDFDGDGRADIAWIFADGHIDLTTMNGTTATAAGTIRAAGTGFVPAFVANFNGDGRDDIVWSHPDGRYSLWLMNGASTVNSTSLIDAGTGWHVVGTPDFNGDGLADLLWRADDGSVGGWLMSGTTQTSARLFLGGGTGWTVVTDTELSGDFKSDLLWRYVDGSYGLWLMDGLNQTQARVVLPGGTGWELVTK